MKRVGFIGLGIMGKAMAKNLARAGYHLVVYDIDRGPVDALVLEFPDAVMGVKTPAAVAEASSDVIITMLPNSCHVYDVVACADGLMSAIKPGQIVVDMSSISPIMSRELGEMLKTRGAHMLDAPVSGGQEKAEKGTLAIMVGGEETLFEQVKDILNVMGASVTLVGDLGAGQITKLVNQIIVAVNISAVAEGMCLAKKSGVDPRRVFEAIRKGLAGSQCLEDKGPRMFEGRYEPGFRIALHMKDLWNVLETSRTVGASVPLSAQVMEMMVALENDGLSSLDHGAIGKYYEKLSGMSLEC